MTRYGKAAVVACAAAFVVSLAFPALAQDKDAKALKTRVLSKLKACGCKESLATCGDCSVAEEIRHYVDQLIEAKVPEEKMVGYVMKSFSGEVTTDQAIPGSAEGPLLVTDSAVYDFGTVSRKIGSINHEFSIHNGGKQDLVFQNMRASCSCAKVCLRTPSGNSLDFDDKGSGPEWRGVLKPGETGVLEIVLSLAQLPAGKKSLEREVFVMTNDPFHSMAVFKVSLELKES